MLDHARRRAREAGARIAFIADDAGCMLEADGSFDAIIIRNLLWTPPEPEDAISVWLRLLKTDGRLLIIDGDFARESPIQHLLPPLDRPFGRMRGSHGLVTPAQWREHRRIMAELPFGADLALRRMTLVRACGYYASSGTSVGAGNQPFFCRIRSETS